MSLPPSRTASILPPAGRALDPGIEGEPLRLHLLERTYAPDFDPAVWERLLERWRTRHPG